MAEYGLERVVVFGEGEDSPAFSRRCSTCGRFLAFKGAVVEVNGLGHVRTSGFTCRRCGEVEPEQVGWAGDFE